MSKFWTAAAGILLVMCIAGLVITSQAPRNSKGAVSVVVRGTTSQAETQTPEGNWLLVRRIGRP